MALNWDGMTSDASWLVQHEQFTKLPPHFEHFLNVGIVINFADFLGFSLHEAKRLEVAIGRVAVEKLCIGTA
jgi:hypothetical protein